MGLILLFSLFPFCVVAIASRRRRHANIIVPSLLAGYSVASAGWFIVGVVHSFAGLAGVEPPMKATMLARGISELMNSTALGFALHVPLFVAAYLADRWLMRRSQTVSAPDWRP